RRTPDGRPGGVGCMGNAVANPGEAAATVTDAAGSHASDWTTAAGGTHTLLDLAGGTTVGEARAIADAGGTLAGFASSTGGTQAFRRSGGVTTGLGFLAGAATPLSRAYGISGNGLVVVGHSNTAAGLEAMRWTSGTGMVSI